MKLIEIRNNLIKLSYDENERPVLGQFIALTGEEKSYVAQYVNLKADNINNFAVAKLMFSFTSDGVVSEYDGSAPSINSKIVNLPANELLDLLPVETPLKIGQISGSNDNLDVDISLFEGNFTVFCENDYEKTTVISNCVRQLFRMKEKSVVIDVEDLFSEYPRITLGQDFKLPLDTSFIDFIFEHDLKNTDATTKAVIQDIFYAVQQYIKTLDNQYLPIENFIDVVTAQYKETQMPELALLKNKLLKYKDAGVFANEPQEYLKLEEKLKERNCVVVNIKDADGELQKNIISYIHRLLETFDKYVYYFVPLKDDNSDKKLLKRIINHSHVFTTVFASHLYKYASELKSHAQNLMFFAPQTMQNDFAAYNTFLNKLSPTEGVIYGKLTQGIPLIISLDNLELDLTKEDVFGDRQRFVPAIEEDILTSDDIYAINSLQEAPASAPASESSVQKELGKQEQEDYFEDISDEDMEEFGVDEYENDNTEIEQEDAEELEKDKDILSQKETEEVPELENTIEHEEVTEQEKDIAQEALTDDKEQIENILADGEYDEESEETEANSPDFENILKTDKDIEDDVEDDEDLSFMDDFQGTAESSSQAESFPETAEPAEDEPDKLTEDDLDFIENSQDEEPVQDNGIPEVEEGEEIGELEDTEDEETPPVVPVYDTDDDRESANENIGFVAGDKVSHPRYGNGTVEKIIKYGNKTLCSIDFENVGRRLLDPSISDFEKVE